MNALKNIVTDKLEDFVASDFTPLDRANLSLYDNYLYNVDYPFFSTVGHYFFPEVNQNENPRRYFINYGNPTAQFDIDQESLNRILNEDIKKIVNKENYGQIFFLLNEVARGTIAAEEILKFLTAMENIKLKILQKLYKKIGTAGCDGIIFSKRTQMGMISLLKYAPNIAEEIILGSIPCGFERTLYHVGKFAEACKNEELIRIFYELRLKISLNDLLLTLLNQRNGDWGSFSKLTKEELYRASGCTEDCESTEIDYHDQIVTIMDSVKKRIQDQLKPFEAKPHHIYYKEFLKARTPLSLIEDIFLKLIDTLISQASEKDCEEIIKKFNLPLSDSLEANRYSLNCTTIAGSVECLHDLHRTIAFAEAVWDAVEEKLTTKDGTIEIVDAGCGGFALLSVFAALKAKKLDAPKGRIKITAIDFNLSSLRLAGLLIEALGLNDYIELKHVEARNYKHNKKIDIFITETMTQALLGFECLPKIADNFAGQLQCDAIAIPENIQVSMGLYNQDETVQQIPNFQMGYDTPVIEPLKQKELFVFDLKRKNTFHGSGVINTEGLSPGVYNTALLTEIYFHNAQTLNQRMSCFLSSPVINETDPIKLGGQNLEIRCDYNLEATRNQTYKWERKEKE